MSRPMWKCHECGTIEYCRSTDKTPKAALNRIKKAHRFQAKKIAPCKGVPVYHAAIILNGRYTPIEVGNR